MNSTCTEHTDIKNNNVNNSTSDGNTSYYLDNRERDTTLHSQNTDSDNENSHRDDSVARRRKIDRKRASVRTKLWRKSMMERSVLPPPPLPPDPSQLAPVDNNTTLSEDKGSYHRTIPDNDNGVLVRADNSVLPTRSHITPPRHDTHVSSSNHEITSSKTTISLKDTDSATLIGGSEISSEKKAISLINQEILSPPVSPPDYQQPSSIPKWMTRKRSSLIKRQSLPSPPVPPKSC